LLFDKKWKMGGGWGGDLEMVVKDGWWIVDGGGGQGKADLLKSRLPRRSEKRKALGAKSAGTQHRHPRGKSPRI
jgi:hypothetical protein